MWLSTQTISRRTQRGVAWLDPCGAELEWASIQKLAGTGLFEVVVNFALSMALQRMLLNSGEVPARWAATIDRYFGSRTLFEQVYQRRQGGLFSNPSYETTPARKSVVTGTSVLVRVVIGASCNIKKL